MAENSSLVCVVLQLCVPSGDVSKQNTNVTSPRVKCSKDVIASCNTSLQHHKGRALNSTGNAERIAPM